jgi:hypothetical protein
MQIQTMEQKPWGTVELLRVWSPDTSQYFKSMPIEQRGLQNAC